MVWNSESHPTQPLKQKAHLRELNKALKEKHDPLLRAHMRQLMKAWGVRVRLPKKAA
jgi:hypothetical protein